MNIPIIIETALAVVTVIILLSIITSAVFELIGRYTRNRSKLLRDALDKALHDAALDKNYGELLFNHPLIKALHRTPADGPSYIAPDTFANALVDTIVDRYEAENLQYDQATNVYSLPPEIVSANTSKKLEAAIKEMEFTELGTLFKSFASSNNEIEEIKSTIILWYNDLMDRVTGWYTRDTQKRLVLVGFFVALALNVDLISITSKIYTQGELRNELVTIGMALEVQNVVCDSTNTCNSQACNDLKTNKEIIDKIKMNYKQLADTGLPIGWNKTDFNMPHSLNDVWVIIRMLLGWLLTGLALSRGAPFWFNVLSTLINLRSSGKVKKIAKT